MPTELDVGQLRAAMKSQGISQAELVKRSNVSRAQVSRLLSRDRARVQDQTITRLASGLAIDPAQLALDGRHQQYLVWLAGEHGFVDFRGIGMPQFRRQEIDEVFVEPDVMSADVDRNEDDGCDGGHGSDRWGGSRVQRTPASEFILKQDRTVVVGHPGTGKTTLLRWLAWRVSRGDMPDAGSAVFVRLPEFSRALEIEPNADPLKFTASMAARRGNSDVESLLCEKLESEELRCLVLFDGLDEVGDENRREQILDAVTTFVEQFPHNRFVLTSRLVGFESSPWRELGFSVVRLTGYGQKQLHEFADKWAKILPKVFGGSEKNSRDSLLSAIFSNSRVQTLASNPLVLTILALLNESRGGALPRRRVDLYAKIVEVFLETWERTKKSSEAFDETSDIELDAREFGWLLADLALAMQRNDRTLAARWWITDRIQDCLQDKLGFELEQAKDIGERILRYLTERTGLIEERGLDQFGFSHRTLQEYFAAMGVIDEADSSTTRDVSDHLSGYFFHPQWSEVVRLVAARVSPPIAESMVSTILDDPDPIGRILLRRGPMLALRCLSDGATVPNRRLVSGIFETLTELGPSKWLGITFEALELLDTFRGTRLEGEATQTVYSILDKARRELDPDEYACLYQHAHWEEVVQQVEDEIGSGFSEAAREVTMHIGGQPSPIIWFNASLRIQQPQDWFKSLCSLVRDDQQSTHFRKCLIRELGRQIDKETRPRRALRKLVESQMPAELRTEAAEALVTGVGDSTLLVRVLERRSEELSVRAACASSLRNVARSDAAIRAKLLQILNSNENEALRAGAARGLARAAEDDQEVTTALLDLANQEGAPDRLRSACAWALDPQIGANADVRRSFVAWLDRPEKCRLRRVAAQALADWMADEPSQWSHELVEKIEGILMGLDDPCPHALDSLLAIATTREVQRVLRLETVLRDALQRVGKRVELAFVFGSTARKRQVQDSDIDLMVIGDVSLRDLSTPLKDAEKTLGRRVEVVPRSRLEFQRKHQSGDPFYIDVCRNEKIPVWPRGMSRKELDDELRTMGAERVAATV